MKGFFAAIRFLLACTVIFGSGYFFAKPHNGTDRTFAPVFVVITVGYLWRSRKPQLPSI
ncbi:MAG TPA: hypothetical protein VGU90_08195 [Terriglobales bacterium]|nr:hypothetical protein [Terriglobales bacterium]